MHALAILTVVVGFAGSAAADPPAKTLPAVKPEDILVKGFGVRPHDKTDGAPGMNNTWATGMVIDPGAHADGQPWPRGMVIAPPDPRDANVLVPGSNHLPVPAAATAPLTERLLQRLHAGVGSILDLVLPAHL